MSTDDGKKKESTSKAIAVAYESARERLGISLARFTEIIKDWEVVPVTVNSCIVGAILVNGPEIHACVTTEARGRWLKRGMLQILADIVKKHGYARTAMTAGNEAGRKFVEHFGFELIETKDGIETWELRLRS